MPVGNMTKGNFQNGITHFGTVFFALTGKTFIQKYRGTFHYIVCVLPGISWHIHNKKVTILLSKKNKLFPLHNTDSMEGNRTRVPSSIRNCKSISSDDCIIQTVFQSSMLHTCPSKKRKNSSIFKI